ncbi:MAG TPA: DeoR family transcriptional regulator [Candidatus Paceibacterota bacterium]
MDKDNNTKDINLKDGSNPVDFILEKNERLVSAIYMVTALLSDHEPIKWKLREVSLKLLSDLPVTLINSTSRVYQRQTAYNYANVEQALVEVDEIVSLINVALAGGSVSQMNFTILKQEYQSLKKIIADNFSIQNLNTYLLSGGEKLVTPMVLETPVRSAPEPVYKSDYSRITERTPVDSNTVKNVVTPNKIEDSRPTIKPISNVVKENLDTKKDMTGGPTKNNRQETIVEYLKGHTWASIKDIAGEIADCSSKTVQRELVELVARGVLKKTGDRRWSRYALNS